MNLKPDFKVFVKNHNFNIIYNILNIFNVLLFSQQLSSVSKRFLHTDAHTAHILHFLPTRGIHRTKNQTNVPHADTHPLTNSSNGGLIKRKSLKEVRSVAPPGDDLENKIHM